MFQSRYESTQLSRVFTQVTLSLVADGCATVTSATPGALFFAYASVIDNVSGDAVFLSAE